jgi:hypothetical protein
MQNYNDLSQLFKNLYGTQPDQSPPEPSQPIPIPNGTGDNQGLPTGDNGFQGTDVNGLYGWQRELVMKASRGHETLTHAERDLIAQLTVHALQDGLTD